jgi:tetratricopeptide (TPR) repeat protein
VYASLGRLDKAIEASSRGARLFEAAYGPDDARVGLALSNVGEANSDAGRYDEAIPPLERAIAILEKIPAHIRTLQGALVNLGNVYYRQKKYAEAIPYFERALKLDVKHPDPADIVACKLHLADSLVATGGDKRRAQQLTTEAKQLQSSH